MARGMRGFTLLEVLIALTLLSMIMLLLFGSLRLVARSWDAGEARAADLDEVVAVQGLLRRLLRESRAFPIRSDQGVGLSFFGDRHRLRLVAPMQAHLGSGGVFWIELEARQHEGVSRLEMRRQPFRADMTGAMPDKALLEPLMTGVERLDLAYFGAPEKGEPMDWQPEWKIPDRLPIRVRLQLVTDQGPGQTLYVELHQ